MRSTHPRRSSVRGAPGAAGRVILLALGLLALTGCQGPEDGTLVQPTPGVVARAPLHRPLGPRLPAFSGGDPARRGWTQVDDLLWIEAAHAEAYRAGRVFDGVGFVPVTQPLPPGTPAARGYRLRTDHVALHTNASWARAQHVAREAEAHVTRLLGRHGDALDLRLPQGPLPVVVTATRAEFGSLLAGLVRDPIGWGAVYDAATGTVYISLEPAARGALPWQADLRHEMTHQVLDLSRPAGRRGRAFAPPWFWLWEGFAIVTEGLGGGVETARAERFARRVARGEDLPWADVLARGPITFTGRHYDQAGAMTAWLLDPAAPVRRAAVLGIVRDLLRGPVAADALARRLGEDAATLEARWRSTLAR